MVAKALAPAGKLVEETFFRNEQLSLCLLIHRRSRTVRVVDFRAGPSQAKRAFVLDFARREGLEKIYTLVERDEVATWVKLGFTREGSLPGFYKRSDAFLVGCVVKRASARVTPLQSETRLAAVRPFGAPLDAADGDLADDERPGDSPAHRRMETTLVQAKKLAKSLAADLEAGRALPGVNIAALAEADARKKVAAALKASRALSAFEPFGRDVARRHFSLTARHRSERLELVASVETQSCFASALVELLTGPTNDKEREMTSAALGALIGKLVTEGVSSLFTFVPSDDVLLASAFVGNGFRRTGLLEEHLVARGSARARKDAIVFTRKLVGD